MKRRQFIKISSLAAASAMIAEATAATLNFLPMETLMPVLFMGHGNPMNAVEDNEFTRGWKSLVKGIPTPKAILCISAHWETKGAKVLSAAQPRMIYDMYGFPQKLYNVKYPAKGSPETARQIATKVQFTDVALHEDWGFDHGCWSVMVHMFPEANIPCFQLSLNQTRDLQWHYDFAKELAFLRKQGVLIVSSGNIIHNLLYMSIMFDRSPDWALEFDAVSTKLIQEGDHKALINYKTLGRAAEISVNSAEHYIPLLYALALQQKNETIQFANHGMHQTLIGGGMRCLKIG